MAVWLESPRESQEKESDSERPRIASAKECGRSDPPTPNPKRMAFGPESPSESREEEGGVKRTWLGGQSTKKKDEADKVAEGEATVGPENEIGRDQLEQTTDQPSWRQIQQSSENPYKIGADKSPLNKF